jgi:hypothetical protein
MMTRKKPWAGMEAANIVASVTSNMRPKIPRDCDPIFKQIIKHCWKHNPAQRCAPGSVTGVLRFSVGRLTRFPRPTFDKIVATLTEYHRSLRDIQAFDDSKNESDSESEEEEEEGEGTRERDLSFSRLELRPPLRSSLSLSRFGL